MSTSIMLVVVWFADIIIPQQYSGGVFQGYVQTDRQIAIPAPTIKIQEMPTMHMCESVGEWLLRSSPNQVKYTCIENVN